MTRVKETLFSSNVPLVMENPRNALSDKRYRVAVNEQH
jgi:hypothetical protein